jgi:hypothetical protein
MMMTESRNRKAESRNFNCRLSAFGFLFGLWSALVPAAAATCTAGDMHIDDNYIYVCTAANTYKRAALSTW